MKVRRTVIALVATVRSLGRVLSPSMAVVAVCGSMQAGPSISFTRPPTPTVTTNGLLRVDFVIANSVPSVVGYWVTFSRVNPTNGATSRVNRVFYQREGSWQANLSVPCLDPETGWRIRAEVDFSTASDDSEPFSHRNPPKLNFQSFAVSNIAVLCLTNAAITNAASFGTNDTVSIYSTLRNSGCRDAAQCSLMLQFSGPVTNTIKFPLPTVSPSVVLNWSTNLPASSFIPGPYELVASIEGGNDTGHNSAHSSFLVIPVGTAPHSCTNRPAAPKNLRVESN
jgi:hypothetical protein